jgi:hypothetical protein
LTLQQWTDLSIVLLAVEAAIMMIAAGITLFYCIRGIKQVDRSLRIGLPKVRGQLKQATLSAETIGEAITSPIIEIRSRIAHVKGLIRGLSPDKGRHQS